MLIDTPQITQTTAAHPLVSLTRWTITDTCLSPDQRFLLYSSISPTVHLVALGGGWDVVESLANVTEVRQQGIEGWARLNIVQTFG